MNVFSPFSFSSSNKKKLNTHKKKKKIKHPLKKKKIKHRITTNEHNESLTNQLYLFFGKQLTN